MPARYCDPSKMTLGAYIEQSLDAAHELAPKTRERYAEIAARWVVPYLGAHKLPKLTREHIKTWHAALLATGLAPRSVLHAHRLVSRVLSEAVAGNIVAGNVAAKAKPPAVPDSELWVEAFEKRLGSCDVLIAIIGKHWMISSEGRRWLENPEDFLRMENPDCTQTWRWSDPGSSGRRIDASVERPPL